MEFNKTQANYLQSKLTNLMQLQQKVNKFLYLKQSWKLRPSKQSLVLKLKRFEKELPEQISLYQKKIGLLYENYFKTCYNFGLSECCN